MLLLYVNDGRLEDNDLNARMDIATHLNRALFVVML